MTTIAIVGAGRGLGAAVARRFGSEGFDVALLSRSQGRPGLRTGRCSTADPTGRRTQPRMNTPSPAAAAGHARDVTVRCPLRDPTGWP